MIQYFLNIAQFPSFIVKLQSEDLFQWKLLHYQSHLVIFAALVLLFTKPDIHSIISFILIISLGVCFKDLLMITSYINEKSYSFLILSSFVMLDFLCFTKAFVISFLLFKFYLLLRNFIHSTFQYFSLLLIMSIHIL